MRRSIGKDSTHCLTGTRGITSSTGCAALRAMRRAPQEGQNPRRLQENATGFSCAQPAQRRRRKPWARRPHARKASNSSLTNPGRAVPVLAWTFSEEGLQMLPQQPMQERVLGPPPLVADRVRRRDAQQGFALQSHPEAKRAYHVLGAPRPAYG